MTTLKAETRDKNVKAKRLRREGLCNLVTYLAEKLQGPFRLRSDREKWSAC